MIFKIGDKIVYPMHGAGVVSAIEEHEIMGEKKQYYILKIPIGDMDVMIPKDNAEEIGIREVIGSAEADRVLSEFKACKDTSDDNWNKRYRDNLLRIKSGDIFEIAHVVKNLMCREKSRGLSTGERKMLANAKQIVISELVVAKSLAQSEVEDIMNDIVNSQIS